MLNTICQNENLNKETSACFAGTCFDDGIIYLAKQGFLGESIVDGPGLRCVLFVQGCPHGCLGCHNPNTHSFTGGTGFAAKAIYEKIKQNPLCKGVTFSGGEPFCQAEALAVLAGMLKADGFELAAYTGYIFEDFFTQTAQAEMQKKLLRFLDILIDGPFVQAKKTAELRFRGSANQRILNVPKSLGANGPVCTKDARWV